MKTSTTRPATAEERARLEEYLKPTRPATPFWIAAVMVGVPATFGLFVALNLLLGGAVPAVLRLALAVAAEAGHPLGQRLGAAGDPPADLASPLEQRRGLLGNPGADR